MATDSQLPSQERLEELGPVLDDLENAFATRFEGYEDNFHESPAHFFEQAYADTIQVIQSIGDEELEKNKPDRSLWPDFGHLFKRAVRLLRSAEKYAEETAKDIESGRPGLRPVHKMLLADWVRLSQRSNIRGNNGTNGIGKHLVHMAMALRKHRPPVEDSWDEDKGDIKPDSGFDAAYAEFLDLDRQTPQKRQDRMESYARASWLRLTQALRALGLPEHLATPPDNFFHNETRPAYVDYPCGSDEFLYGKGKRQGILAVKQMLGGPLTDEEKARIRAATRKRKGSGPPERPEGSKRNQASVDMDKIPSDPTHLAGLAEYMTTYTRRNAMMDLADAGREGSYQADAPFPRAQDSRLLLPTHANHMEMLQKYAPELSSMIYEEFESKFGMDELHESLPRTAEERAPYLKAAEEEVEKSRAMVESKIGRVRSLATAKELRIAAFRLKLSRSVYMLGFFSGIPWLSDSETRGALRDRLTDWILHEQAWNVADMQLLSLPRLSAERKAALNEDIEARKSNIETFTRYIAEIDAVVDEDGEVGDRDSDVAAEADVKPEDDNVGETEETRTAEEESAKDGVPWLTQEEIKTAKLILNDALNPKLPDRGDYLLDKRSERRRCEWFEKMAVARLTGKPVPAWTHKKVVDPFTDGGPPGHEELPRETVWDRLQLMWVLTFWQFYQLRHLEP
ncbi:hypothetical protein F5Y17DRAFT_460057 [Xylariaceae sp. FL0594]|nr:hypothetical protein F5Y17DRAFT_460057 [Xylariaceae sp. FL0594]